MEGREQHEGGRRTPSGYTRARARARARARGYTVVPIGDTF